MNIDRLQLMHLGKLQGYSHPRLGCFMLSQIKEAKKNESSKKDSSTEKKKNIKD